MKKILMGLTCALVLTTVPVLAASSVNGSTGLINTPTADALRSGQFSLGYYHLQDGSVSSFTTNVAPNFELGLAAFSYDGQSNKNYLNAKIGVVPETVLHPGLAIGAEDIANQDQRSVYAVASKALPFGFRIHTGIGTGRFNGVFAGLEKTINPLGGLMGNKTFPATNLIVEYDGSAMNYGARLAIVPGLKLDVGLRQHKGYIGINFTH